MALEFLWPITQTRAQNKEKLIHSTLKMFNKMNGCYEASDAFCCAECTWPKECEFQLEKSWVFLIRVCSLAHIHFPHSKKTGVQPGAWQNSFCLVFFLHSLNFEAVTLCCCCSYSATVYSSCVCQQFDVVRTHRILNWFLLCKTNKENVLISQIIISIILACRILWSLLIHFGECSVVSALSNSITTDY